MNRPLQRSLSTSNDDADSRAILSSMMGDIDEFFRLNNEEFNNEALTTDGSGDSMFSIQILFLE